MRPAHITHYTINNTTMNSVVQSSSSVYSTFISTVDHLPCDIVRLLWYVQSCNLHAEQEKEKLHQLLLKHPHRELARASKEVKDAVAAQYYELQRKIRTWNDESVAEMESLCNQLSSHEAMLNEENSQLQRVADTPLPLEVVQSDVLREQLNKHYKENPLKSQVEALQERVLKDLGKVVIRKVAGRPTGIKIILKLSGNERKLSGKRAKDELFDSDWLSASPPIRGTKSHKKKGRSPAVPGRGRGRPRKYPLPVTALEKAPKGSPLKVSKVEFEEVDQLPVLEEPEQYCFCKQPSFGDMIACDNEKCPNGEWFHYKCVGLLSKAEANKLTSQKWYCSNGCREAAAERKLKKRKKRTGW